MTTEIFKDIKGKNYSIKDPDSTLDWSFDWSKWLLNAEAEIMSYEIVISSGLTKISDQRETSTITALVSGGVIGATESITCRITTTDGRIEDNTIYLRMEQK